MSDIASLRAHVKVNMRACLISSPVGVAIAKLRSDYYSLVGERLPVKELGYTDIEDMVRDMPDVVNIQCSRGQMVLTAVADKATARIQSLVQRQKVPTKRRPQRYGYGHYDRYIPPQPRLRPSPLASRDVKPFIRQHIQQLLDAYPTGVSLSKFETAFDRRYGYQLCYYYQQNGFNSLLEMMKFLMDIVSLQRQDNGEMKVSLRYAKSGRNETSKPIHINTAPSDGRSGMVSGHQQHTTAPRSPSICKTSGIESRDTASPEVWDMDDVEEVEVAADETLESVLQREITQILGDFPCGLQSVKLPGEYKARYGRELPWKEQGYWNLIEFISSMPETVDIRRPTRHGDWLLYHPQNAPPEVGKEFQKEPVGIDEEFKEKLRDLIQCYPSGILLTDLPIVFKREMGYELNVEDLGFSSLEMFLFSLMDKYLHIVYKGEGRVFICPMTKDREEPALPAVVQVPETELDNIPVIMPSSPKSLKSSVTPQSHRPDLPYDVVGEGSAYKSLTLDIHQFSDLFELYVSNIDNPGRFWLQLRGPRHHVRLEQLMNELELVYENSVERNLYRMPDYLIKVGQICVAVFPEDRNWHRVSILAINDPDFVKVYYVDYGNTCSVSRSRLRLLRDQFLELPAQAIRGRLAHIRPPDGRRDWCHASRQRMLNLTRDRPLVGRCTSIDIDRTSDSYVMSLCLIDTSTEDDIHVNDVLLNESLARLVPDNQDQNEEQPEEEGATEEVNPLPEELPSPDHNIELGHRHSSSSDSGVASRADTASHTAESVKAEAEDKHRPTSSGDNGSIGAGEDTDARKYVKFVQLTDTHCMHLINLSGIPHVMSTEISAFFWLNDILRTVLHRKHIDVKSCTVDYRDEEALFEELATYKTGLKENGIMKPAIKLYTLDAVTTVLEKLAHPVMALRKAVRDLLEAFDPTDSYWTGISACAEESSVTAPLTMDLNELSLSLQILQFKRKRLLQQMMLGSVKESNAVEEQRSIESKIISLRDEIKHHPSNLASKSPTTVTKLLNSSFQPPPLYQSGIIRAAPVQVVTPVKATQATEVSPCASAVSAVIPQSVSSVPHQAGYSRPVTPSKLSTASDTSSFPGSLAKPRPRTPPGHASLQTSSHSNLPSINVPSSRSSAFQIPTNSHPNIRTYQTSNGPVPDASLLGHLGGNPICSPYAMSAVGVGFPLHQVPTGNPQTVPLLDPNAWQDVMLRLRPQMLPTAGHVGVNPQNTQHAAGVSNFPMHNLAMHVQPRNNFVPPPSNQYAQSFVPTMRNASPQMHQPRQQTWQQPHSTFPSMTSSTNAQQTAPMTSRQESPSPRESGPVVLLPELLSLLNFGKGDGNS